MSNALMEAPAGQLSPQSLALLEKTSDEAVSTMMLTHNDADVIARVQQSLPDEEAVVLPIAQSEWNERIDDLLTVAAGAGLSRLVIVGHSGGHSSRTDMAESSLSEPTPPGGLFSGALRTQQELKEARAHFVAVLQRVADHQGLSRLRSRNEINVVPLFYIHASDMFLMYNVDTQSCSPLTRSLAADTSH